MDLTALLTPFVLIFLSELGDKTQICAIILSSKGSASSVFLGAMTAFLMVDGLSALLGGELLALMPHGILGLITGLVFIFFGLISLLYKSKSVLCERSGKTLVQTFSLISLMEIGDKTQIASVLLAAKIGNPILALISIMLAFATVTGIGVLLGYKILRFMPEKYLRIIASMVFIMFGLIFILETLLNIELLP
ncbi:MAG: TMEM165/GDT1 family protein [Candidatus Bathyarchaeia archaeon]|nr:TMEM165/GDT1 family protein [Candidatus Bathyarchaeota archaeon]